MGTVPYLSSPSRRLHATKYCSDGPMASQKYLRPDPLRVLLRSFGMLRQDELFLAHVKKALFSPKATTVDMMKWLEWK